MAFKKFPFPKDPSETLDYSVDLSPKCGTDAKDAVVRCESDNASDITITNVQVEDGIVSCTVAGGVAGAKYDLWFQASFAEGPNVGGETAVLSVKER